METITRSYLITQLNYIQAAAKTAGIIAPNDNLVLLTGGSITGVQVWLIQYGESGYSHAPFAPFGGLVGMTKREAARTLEAVRLTLQAVNS